MKTLPIQTPTADQAKNSWLRVWDGPLTRELVLKPASFGLGHVPQSILPDETTRTVCGYCSTGCALNVHLREGQAVNVSPSGDYPVNLGMACPKGWESLSALQAPDRATAPLLRDRSGTTRATTWDEALSTFCERFKRIIAEHGPDSVAFLSTGQIPTEEMVLLGMLTKFGMGWRIGDSNTRQCMATAAVAYKQSFGFDAPPYTYADFEESDLIVLVGANLCVAHPILWERVLRNRRGARVVVVDPRRTETAQAANLHLAIQPKSDQALLYGLAKALIRRGAIDEAFIARSTTGFEAFANFVESWTTEKACHETGVSVRDFEQLVDWIAGSRRTSFWWTMGVNQSYQGVRTAQAIINLALMTGNIGRPGTGANSITGQCNAMGSRLFSNTSTLLGGRDFGNEGHRREVAEIVGVEPALIPDSSGPTYDQILDKVRRGEVRGLWIIATNTVHSWTQQAETRAALGKLDFLVVQDMYTTTETAQVADLLLPAAAWGEKTGTFINSERRIGLLKKVARAPGQALADFSIFRLIGEYWGCGDLLAAYQTPEDVFGLMRRLSHGRPCDLSGVEGYDMLEQQDGIQWPLAAGRQVGSAERRLFEDGRFFHPDRRARFYFDAPAPMPERPCEEYPLVLLTGRGSVAQWHTQTRTGKSPILRKLYPQKPYVEISPADARQRGIRNGDLVIVSSRRGACEVTAVVLPTVGDGQVFMPMHYSETNRLTLPHFDTHSRQPSYKDCAVQVSAGRKRSHR
jgi:assimilatory nitrate reductase catalytic subunit